MAALLSRQLLIIQNHIWLQKIYAAFQLLNDIFKLDWNSNVLCEGTLYIQFAESYSTCLK